MKVNFRAEDLEDQLMDYEKLIVQCLRENLGRYMPNESKEDVTYWVNRVRDKLVLDTIEAIFVAQNW